ncbi:DUF3134 domain-containing protein [Chlorogloeopsis fritschii PCC 9212]|jgi:hypothetical protein|uniref:DUF3134 domain-containing protein n=1 Tax=Chlorogloeopsis fritschii PCC 6912 TaxID=211165 RepID=A0A3S1FFY7_CHLFR|nr:DUF3134 domain-containing protein [Chlorogloeopsis fritschii]MBF2006569.1 DUF3134 domain-containing protein [Chlorogloeopsis fritschii C42_A2020_084]RUR77508.1 hypothetical protein PCC6912_38990 [Chlorogloeopsis fritschii PCC 6912]
MLNSPLREQPRNQRAAVIPLKQESSLLDWLQASGRLIARDNHEQDFSEENEEEITEFLGGEDGIGDYDFDDDDDIVPDED